MPKLTIQDYCKDCPYFKIYVFGYNTPDEYITLMNKDETEARCEHKYICNRMYEYVRKRCGQC